MVHKQYKKFAIIGFVITTVVCLYILFGDHDFLERRYALEMDFQQLEETRTGPEILEALRGLNLHCEVAPTPLGDQVCGAMLAEYEGIPADNIMFYFDAQQRLTAVKLSLPASEHEALATLLQSRYGTPITAEPVATWSVANGQLALGAPEGDTTTTLWIAKSPENLASNN